MIRPLRVAVTGAAGQICYSLLPRIAAGEMFGPEQPIILQLLEIPVEKAQAALRGVAMELDDCAFPLLQDLILSDDPKQAFTDADWCLLVGSKPRGPGMERADLLTDNGKIFIQQGQVIDQLAADNARITVVGNPCNSNCMIGASQCRRLGPERWTAMTRLDQNRATALLAQKAGVPVSAIEQLIIYGNHSPTMFPDIGNARVAGKPAEEVVTDQTWLRDTFIPTVAKRGAAIIEARGLSSAASAANALIDHVRALNTPSDNLHSIGVQSDGSYGFEPGVWASVPVRTTSPGSYEVVKDLPLSDFAKERIGKTNAELVGERETVASLL